MNKIKGKIEGYSLVESLVALAIGMVLVTFVFNTIIYYSKSITSQNQFVEVLRNLEFSMDLLKREISEAGYEISIGEKINLAEISSLTFRRKVTNFIENVQYCLYNNSLMKKTGDDSSFSTASFHTVMGNVESLNFEYFKANSGTPFLPSGSSGYDSREEIQKIRIIIKAKFSAEGLNSRADKYRRITLSSLVQLRNMSGKYTLILKATPNIVPVASDSSIIEAVVSDRKGKPINSKVTVDFSGNAGSLSPTQPMTSNGVASSTLTYADNIFKIITVTARATIDSSALEGKIAVAFQ